VRALSRPFATDYRFTLKRNYPEERKRLRLGCIWSVQRQADEQTEQGLNRTLRLATFVLPLIKPRDRFRMLTALRVVAHRQKEPVTTLRHRVNKRAELAPSHPNLIPLKRRF